MSGVSSLQEAVWHASKCLSHVIASVSGGDCPMCRVLSAGCIDTISSSKTGADKWPVVQGAISELPREMERLGRGHCPRTRWTRAERREQTAGFYTSVDGKGLGLE
ncbi:hypothetical protein BaRGS_00033604 [Batillaria attramentaria]|uniref:Uncharacterized protein n=1 Tax=Batillaria attramentaria TaxID=370345 RepID=A0ABD0JKB1_9CAEN